MNRNDFIDLIKDSVIKVNNEFNNVLFNSVVIAQAILETGWGNSEIMMKANAIFGIKATSDWKGKVYNSKTKECYDGVNFTTVSDCFRAYDRLEDSIRDYFSLITGLSRYKKALNCSSAKDCITAIKNGGYATDPNYIDTIMNIIYENNLEQYDGKTETRAVEETQRPVYEVGRNYTTQVDLNVRAGAGTNNRIKNYSELTYDGKKHAYNQQLAVLKKGTVVTCLAVYYVGNDIWIRIPSGYIASFYNGKEYVK